jgi:hypothetical protein
MPDDVSQPVDSNVIHNLGKLITNELSDAFLTPGNTRGGDQILKEARIHFVSFLQCSNTLRAVRRGLSTPAKGTGFLSNQVPLWVPELGINDP